MNKELGTAVSDSFGTKHPTSVAGLSFKLPLDFGLISKLRESFRNESEAARLSAEQKTIEEDQAWEQFNNLYVETSYGFLRVSSLTLGRVTMCTQNTQKKTAGSSGGARAGRGLRARSYFVFFRMRTKPILEMSPPLSTMRGITIVSPEM